MRVTRVLTLLALGVAWMGMTLACVLTRRGPMPAMRPALGLPVLWPAPAFSFLDQDRHEVTTTSLAGRIWIANFIFTQCTAACPMMTAKLVRLQQRLVHPEVRFISFSVDPTHDSPGVLKRYAEGWHGDQARWRLLSTTPDGLRATAAGLRVSVQATSERLDPIIHSNRFLLIDPHGKVRGAYDSTDDEDLRQLVTDAERLLADDGTGSRRRLAEPLGRARSGAALYAELGCRGCHDNSRLAPGLRGLPGTRVTLTDGSSLTCDDAYLRESILSPATKVVAGYGPTMPSYAGLLSEPALLALTDHIKALGPSARTAAPVRVIDPVCQMAITATASTPHRRHGGEAYFFCSQACLQKFTASPRLYAQQ